MREFITLEYDTTAIILLAEESQNYPFVILEGLTDEKLWRICFNKFVKYHIPDNTGNQKQSVITIVKKANSRGLGNVIGIIDSDFDKLCSVTYPTNVFITDYHDINVMLFVSPILEKYLPERGSIKKTSKLLMKNPTWSDLIEPLRLKIIEWAYYIGLLKFISLKKGVIFQILAEPPRIKGFLLLRPD